MEQRTEELSIRAVIRPGLVFEKRFLCIDFSYFEIVLLRVSNSVRYYQRNHPDHAWECRLTLLIVHMRHVQVE